MLQMISDQLKNVLVCSADVSINWCHKRNKSYNECMA